MAELTVKTHATYTYETSDGREFEDKDEAMEWQKHLCNIARMCLLGSDYKPIDMSRNEAVYVYAKTFEQADSFNDIRHEYYGWGEGIPGAGFYRYDEINDKYVDIEAEIAQLQRIIDKLKEGAEECQTVG